MLYLGHMLPLGIIKSSSFFMWHPKVNSAYSIPHLMNHRTIHRNIKEKLPKNVLKWEKVRKSEKKWKKVKNWENLTWHWLGNTFFSIDPTKLKKTNWEKLRKIEKMFPGKKGRLRLGVKMKQCIKDLEQEWTIWLSYSLFLHPPYHLHKFVWHFSPRLSMTPSRQSHE